MSSWSPPESSGHELHQNHLEMAGQRADWDYNMTKVLLDLCIAEKEKFNYVGNKGPTKHGWRLVHQTFLAQTGWNLQKKQLQSKFHDLKRKYKLWKRLKAASGGGWDSRTGTITMDDDWWADRIKEDENAATFRKKPMQFEEELGVLFGTTDSEDSNLLCVGGIGDRTPSNGSDDNTPQSDDNMGRSGVGRACQRTGNEQVVDSPPSKRRKSVEYYVEKLSESMLERSRNESSARSREQDEIAELLSVVQADGVSKSDELYFIATDLFRNQSRRTAFRTFDLPEERIAWLRWTWDNVKKK